MTYSVWLSGAGNLSFMRNKIFEKLRESQLGIGRNVCRCSIHMKCSLYFRSLQHQYFACLMPLGQWVSIRNYRYRTDAQNSLRSNSRRSSEVF